MRLGSGQSRTGRARGAARTRCRTAHSPGYQLPLLFSTLRACAASHGQCLPPGNEVIIAVPGVPCLGLEPSTSPLSAPVNAQLQRSELPSALAAVRPVALLLPPRWSSPARRLPGTRSSLLSRLFSHRQRPGRVERVAAQRPASSETADDRFVCRSSCVHFAFIFRSAGRCLSRIASTAGVRNTVGREA